PARDSWPAHRKAFLLQIIPALERRLVAPARQLDFLLEELLSAEILRRGARAARGGALAIAFLRLDALVAARFGLFQRSRGGARLLVGLVEGACALLGRRRARRCAHDERRKNND